MSCFFSLSDRICGLILYVLEDVSIIFFRVCRKDLFGYFISLGVSGCCGIGISNILVEYEFIFNCVGFYNLLREDMEKMMICLKYRYEFFIYF